MQVRWLIAMAGLLMLALVAANPWQDGRPPSPLEPDFYSGTVTVQGSTPPAGTQLVACIDGCDSYQSDPVSLNADGSFSWLTLRPESWDQIGDEVTFHITTVYGSIQANETNLFVGARQLPTVTLTFSSCHTHRLPDGHAAAHTHAAAHGHAAPHADARPDPHAGAYADARAAHAHRDARAAAHAHGHPAGDRRHRRDPRPRRRPGRRHRLPRGRRGAVRRRHRPPPLRPQRLPPHRMIATSPKYQAR